MSRIFGFKHRYPQSFLDELAKAWGFKWTKVKCTPVKTEDVSVHPLPPPTGTLFYTVIKYKDE